MAVDLTPYAASFSPQVLQAVQALFAAKPDQEQAFVRDYGGDMQRWLDSAVGWWSENGHTVGDRTAFAPELSLLDALGYQINPQAATTPTTATGTAAPGAQQLPAEQVLGNYALGQAVNLINGDAQRTADAQNLIASYQPQFDAAKQTIGSLSQTINAPRYFAENPDVATAYQQLVAGGSTLTPQQFALQHWQQSGQFEGRKSPMQASEALQGEVAASNQAAAEQNAALDTQLQTLQANLSGELATKAQAIRQQVAALSQGLGTFTADERAALANQVASQFQALEQEGASRRTALTQQLGTMQGAVTTHDQAMRAALETELNKLNAAQKPLNDARVTGAQTLAASANLGAQAAMDRVAAESARAGYIGSSTGSEMAIARAAMGGRQAAAEALGQARIANATDDAAIGRYGANAEAGIARDTAKQNRDLSFFGAGETRTLSDYDASQRRGISDFASGNERQIAGNHNQMTFDLTRFQAGEDRSLTDYGATQTRTIGDYGAGEKRNIADANANRKLGFFSGDLQRRIAALALPAAALQTEFDVRNAATRYGQSGFDQAMKNLNYFRTNGGNAPGSNPVITTPVQNGYENLGAGLISAAGNIARGSNYWSQPTNRTTTPDPNLYDSNGNPID